MDIVQTLSKRNRFSIRNCAKFVGYAQYGQCPIISFSDVDAYIIEESGDKYLIFALTKKIKKCEKKYAELFDEIKNQIETINGGESILYKKDFMKIRLDSYYDDLPLGKILSFSVFNIIVKSVVFQNKNKYYPQIHIHNCEYECEY